MTSNKDLGHLLKSLRESKHLTQEELAREVRVTAVAIQNYESGRRYPKRPVMALLSQTLGVKEFYLLMTPEERAKWDSIKASEQPSNLDQQQALIEKNLRDMQDMMKEMKDLKLNMEKKKSS